MINSAVSGIYSYPIKSCGGILLEEAIINGKGIINDREYMLVNCDYKHVNQNDPIKAALLAAVAPQITKNGILLTAPKMPQLEIVRTVDKQIDVDLYGMQCSAYDLGNEAAEWFSDYLGAHYRFVRQATARHREVEVQGTQIGLDLSFTNGYNLLITNNASLEYLNEALVKNGAQPVDMHIFRPNIVINGESPWEEDAWRDISIGNIMLKIIKPCVSNAITTINQQTGDEILSTLAQFRKGPGFGVYARPLMQGRLYVGDPVMMDD